MFHCDRKFRYDLMWPGIILSNFTILLINGIKNQYHTFSTYFLYKIMIQLTFANVQILWDGAGVKGMWREMLRLKVMYDVQLGRAVEQGGPAGEGLLIPW